MNGQMTITDVRDFATVAAAAQVLGVSQRTVMRMVADGVLDKHVPRHAPNERVTWILSVAQIAEVKKARETAGVDKTKLRRPQYAGPVAR